MTITLEELKGKVYDLDSHEQMPVAQYGNVFGERGHRFTDAAADMMSVRHVSHAGDFGPDIMEITPRTVWEVKGSAAPGVMDFDRRTQVMDMMGVYRQLVFSTFGGCAFAYAMDSKSGPEQVKIGLAAMDACNEWTGGIGLKYPDRLRMVGHLATGQPDATPGWLVTETERIIELGNKAVLISSGHPPSGLSPAHRDLDPFYATLAVASVPLVFHVGASPVGFRRSDQWMNLPDFLSYGPTEERDPLDEIVAAPVGASVYALAEQNFLAVMVMGGVFDRHPDLRVGAIELASWWVGPLAERMDLVTDTARHHIDKAKPLSMRPSEYLNRHLRVTPQVFEPLDKFLDRYPEVQDVYCYTSDYPHIEGNRWSMNRFYDTLVSTSDDYLKKFFITNGQALLA